MYAFQKARGFTLIEILIAVAIVAILASIVLMGMEGARQKARDTQRMSDVQQVQVALRSYVHVFGEYPSHPNGIHIGGETALDELLAPYVQEGIRDPRNEDEYQYYYDSAYTCDGDTHIVIMAHALEAPGAGNYEEVCGTSVSNLGNGVTPSSATYIRIVR